MPPIERITRPIPERTGSIRSWSALLGAAAARSGDAGTPGGATLGGVVSRSVEVGYRVVDEYLRHGQRVAERLGDRSLTPGTMVQDFQELTARMARYASDLMDVWFQLIELAAAGRGAPHRPSGDRGAPADPAPPRAPEPPAAGSTGRDSHDGEGGTRVSVQIASLQPAEVTLDLRPGSTGLPLIVHALRAAEPDKPRLTEIALEPASEDGVRRLRIRIPPEQPPGVYNGLVIDERTSRPAGTLSVRVGPSV